MRPRASTSKRCDEHIEALWRVHRRAVASTSKRCESHRHNGVVHTARMESFVGPGMIVRAVPTAGYHHGRLGASSCSMRRWLGGGWCRAGVQNV